MIFLLLLFQIQNFAYASLECRDHKSYSVHLTFDDGPQIPETEMILNGLKKRKIKATFFLSMHRFKSLLNGVPDEHTKALLKLVQRMKDEGHTIGNHSFEHLEHANSETTKPRHAMNNLENSFQAVKKLKLIPPIPFRFPEGSGWFEEKSRKNAKTANDLVARVKQEGSPLMHWDIDSWDWHESRRRAMKRGLLHDICEYKGGVILLHDTQEFTAKNLTRIIDSILASKHKIVSYSEIRQVSKQSVKPFRSLMDSFNDSNCKHAGNCRGSTEEDSQPTSSTVGK